MHPGQDVLSMAPSAPDREWIAGNGLGAYARGSAAGLFKSRSQAHLVVAGPHGRRWTVLLGFGERLLLPEGAIDLTPRPDSGGRRGALASLEGFWDDPWPVWRIRAGDVVLEKTLFLIDSHQAVVVVWRHLDGPPTRLSASPLVVGRAPHELETREREMRGALQAVPGRVRVETRDPLPALTLWHNAAFLPARVWQRIAYAVDVEGGAPAMEDAFVPGYLEGALAPDRPLIVIASSEDDLFRALAREDRVGTPPPKSLAGVVDAIEAGERARRASWRRAARAGATRTAAQARAAHRGEEEEEIPPRLLPDKAPWLDRALEALELGLVRRGRRLAALGQAPGGVERGDHALRLVAALVSFRAFEAARELLRGAIEYLDEGVAPESFDSEDGTPRYGDPKPSLWLVSAAELYVRRSGDLEFARTVLDSPLEAISQSFRAGTRHGIRVDADGLLAQGEGEKHADVNALWYHAQVALAQLARTLGKREHGAFFLAWAHEHQRRYHEAFWDGERGELLAAIGPDGPRTGLAPSHVLAASLKPTPLPPEAAVRLLATIERELWTPWGLRAAPGATTIEPEWAAPFLSASLRLGGRTPAAQAEVLARLAELEVTIARLGYVPERFELDPAGGPVRAAGEPLSVLAAAEFAQLWVEELDHEPIPDDSPLVSL